MPFKDDIHQLADLRQQISQKMILVATHRQNVTVLRSNIIFCDICCFTTVPACDQIKARFVGRRYTTRPGAPTIIVNEHEQKVHSWVVFWTYRYQ